MTGRDVAALRQEYIHVTQIEPWGEAAAVAVLLGFDRVAADKRFYAHVDRDGVDWDAVLADETWSTGEQFLIATAAGSWNGRLTLIDISRVAWLDDRFLQTWFDIVHARINGRVPDGTTTLIAGNARP
ncbi:MAG: hypothetical protein ACRDP7_45940 [Trebonia sp.]